MEIAESTFHFFVDNTYILFFINGLAFFALGMSIALEKHRASIAPMGDGLWLLSAYGFAASLSNWLRMVLSIQGSVLEEGVVAGVHLLSLLSFVWAALFLLQCGMQMLTTHRPQYAWLRVGFWALVAVHLTIVVATSVKSQISHGDSMATAEVWTRYLLYTPALAVTTLAFLAQRRAFLQIKLPDLAGDCLRAAASLGLKVVLSGVVAIPILGISGSLESLWTLLLQALRTLTTIAFAFFVVRILRAFALERRRRLDVAVQGELAVKEQALADQEQVCHEIQRWCTSMADMVQAVSSAISRPVPLAETLHIALCEVLRLTGFKCGSIFLLDEKEPVLRLVAHEGLPDWICDRLTEVRVGDGLAGWVAQEGELLIVDDITRAPRAFVPGGSQVVTCCVGVPLQARGKVVGVLNLSDSERQKLSREQKTLLIAIGQQLGVAVENARLYEQVRYVATVEERNRLAREVHDTLSQQLGYLNLKAASAGQYLAKNQIAQAQDDLLEVKRIARAAYADARETIFSLRATASDAGFLSALRDYLDEYRTYYGLESEFIVDDTSLARLPTDVSIQVLCIIQEALTNVRRHADATRVWVRLQPHGSEVQVTIRDDGRGFDLEQTTSTSRPHFGLSVMRERAESVGGRVEFESAPGEGTKVIMWVPRSRQG